MNFTENFNFDIYSQQFELQLYESLHEKLERALKEKLAALEDRLNILVQLRDSEERVADSEAFIDILKVFPLQKSRFISKF